MEIQLLATIPHSQAGPDDFIYKYNDIYCYYSYIDSDSDDIEDDITIYYLNEINKKYLTAPRGKKYIPNEFNYSDNVENIIKLLIPIYLSKYSNDEYHAFYVKHNYILYMYKNKNNSLQAIKHGHVIEERLNSKTK